MEASNVTMGTVVSSIASTLSADNLWGVIGNIVPILGISVLVGLGFYLVKRIARRLSRAKGGM